MRDHGTYTVDPLNTAALRRRAEERAAKARELRRAHERQTLLSDQLARDPATSALAELQAAAEAHARTQAELDAARAHHREAADAAARFAAADLVTAQDELDEATRAVSDALAILLREATMSTMLTATVDGLALRERYRTATAVTPPAWDHMTIPFPATPADVVDPELALPTVDPAEGTDYCRLLAVLERLDERVDAVADLVTAESVHQLVQGNPTRAGAALAVASEGRVPDELDVIRTPRPGHDVVQRVLVLLDAEAPPAWSAPSPGLAAALDPILAAWASRLLPDPSRVGLRVSRIDPDTGEAGHPLDLTAADLALDPLAWIRVAADPAELRQRIARVARSRWTVSAGAEIGQTGRVVEDPAAPGGAGLRLSDLLAAAGALGRLVARTRALAGEDLAHPAQPASAAPPPAEAVAAVAARIRAAEQAVAELVAALESAATGSVADPAALIDRLFEAASLGVADAVPALDGSGVVSEPVLQAQAAAAAARLRERVVAIPFADDAADPGGTLARARTAARRVCAMELPLPVEITVPLDAIAQGHLGSGAAPLAGATPAALRAWLYDHARVRTAVRSLTAAYDLSEAVAGGEVLDMRATQLPVTTGDTWAGATATPRPGAVSLVVQRGYAGDIPAQLAGLVVDSWNQAVPASEHDSGMAFHFDQPDATPPQAMLVAVHPDPDSDDGPATWDLDALLEVVTSTLALARNRAVAAERRTASGVTVGDAT